MKWKAQIISHTHWDREWYLNSKYTAQWSIIFFQRLFEMFEKEKDYQFVLDGQMLLLDDYFETLKKQGKSVYKYKQKIKKYVEQGRLHIGPYYLQPDWQLVSGESLIRNLTIGIKKAKEYGPVMQIGWLLDNFGQISQTAQIHKEAEIKGLFVWRGVEMDPNNVQSEFLWESPDKTTLSSVYLLNSYRNVMRLAQYNDIMKERIDGEIEKLKDFMTTKNVLLMNGYDQEMVPDDIQPYIKEGKMDSESIEIIQSNPTKYLESVLAEKPNLITLKGALYSGRFISVFPGVMSARMYLKLQNDKAQKAITLHSEPLSTINWILGDNYPSTLFENAWQLLLTNHPHDSICSCSIDDVHSDMEERFRDFHFLVDKQIDNSLSYLASLIDTSKQKDDDVFIAFNSTSYNRDAVININNQDYFVKNIPSFGYKIINQNEITDPVMIDDNKINNSLIEVSLNDNGTYNIYHKKSDTLYKNLGYFIDSGDAGDEYNYSYPDCDTIFDSRDAKAKISILKESKQKVEIAIDIDMTISCELTNDRKTRSAKTITMPIRSILSVETNSDVIKVKTVIKNTAKDHIVKAIFPTDLQTDISYSATAFDVVENPIHIDDYDEDMIPENVRKVIVGAREAKPNTIFLTQEMVDLYDGEKGLSILSKGLPEYTIIKERNAISLALFRGCGWVAKDINTRIGDAGPEIFTPGAQCIRTMEFEYAIYPHLGNYEDAESIRKADDYNNELLILSTNKHKSILPPSSSFINVDSENNNIRVTSLKKSDESNNIILRVYNCSNKVENAKFSLNFNISKAKRVNFLENEKETLAIDNNSFNLEVKPKKIETISIKLSSMPNIINSNKKQPCFRYENENIYDLEEYNSMDSVTKEDVINEEKRAVSLEDGLNAAITRRTSLEAQLSAILTQNRFNEAKTFKLGYQLNEARVKRRICDYVKDSKNFK